MFSFWFTVVDLFWNVCIIIIFPLMKWLNMIFCFWVFIFPLYHLCMVILRHIHIIVEGKPDYPRKRSNPPATASYEKRDGIWLDSSRICYKSDPDLTYDIYPINVYSVKWRLYNILLSRQFCSWRAYLHNCVI